MVIIFLRQITKKIISTKTISTLKNSNIIMHSALTSHIWDKWKKPLIKAINTFNRPNKATSRSLATTC